jgi:hypothetical protein
MIFPVGATSQSITIQIVDDSGQPVTGLVAATFPTLNYCLEGPNANVAFPALSDLAAITTAYSSGGVKERVNGYYRLDVPNGVFTTAGQVRIMGEATGKRVLVAPIDVGASVLLSAGTGAGQLDFTSGVVKSNLSQILGTALTETAGQIAAAFKKLFNVAVPTFTMDSTGSTLSAVPDTAGTTTLLGRLTSARAGYLDNLNVGGALASHADILAINQSASKHLLIMTVAQMEPGEAYTVECRTFAAADGSAVNADSTPTLTATGAISGSLAGNLGAVSNPATGVYRATYTVPGSPTLEQIRFDVSATISAATFTLSSYTQTVDEATVVFSATDQAHLTAVYNKLPAANIAGLGDAMTLTSAYDLAKTAAQPADVLTEVNAALDATTAELTAVPAAISSLRNRIAWVFALGRNKRTQTSTTELLRNDADSATIGTAAKSDDGTTFTRGKFS